MIATYSLVAMVSGVAWILVLWPTSPLLALGAAPLAASSAVTIAALFVSRSVPLAYRRLPSGVPAIPGA